MPRKLFAVFILCLTAIAVVLLSMQDVFFEQGEPFPRTFPVIVLNERQNTHIWLNNRVRLQVWEVDADASDDPLAVFWGSLDLPGSHLGSGFSLERATSGEGSITLQEHVDLGRYLRRGYLINLDVYVVPGGFHSEEAPFRIGPGVQNAFGKIQPADFPMREPVRLYHRPTD